MLSPLSAFLVGALSLITAPAQGGPEAELEIMLAPSSVSVAGVSPGGSVVLFAVSREPRGHSSSLSRRDDLLVDGEGDGLVELELELGLPLRSVWAAVDLASGRAAFAAPEGFLLRLDTLPPGWLIGNGEGQAEALTLPRGFAELLVVSPAAAGAWGAAVFDGSQDDDDGPANNRLSAAVRNLKPLHGGPPAPDRLGPHDVVIIVDANTLEVFAVRHGGPQA